MSEVFGPIDLGMWTGPGWDYVREMVDADHVVDATNMIPPVAFAAGDQVRALKKPED